MTPKLPPIPTLGLACSALCLAAPAAAQDLRAPAGVAVAADGRLVVADRGGHVVYAVDHRTGALTVVAGTGTAGYSGDGGPATQAEFRNPEWVAFDGEGHLWIADRGNGRIRVLDDATGIVATRVGTGSGEATGDGGPAAAAGLTQPFGVATGPRGAVYVFDTEAHRIRRVDPATGTIRTVIGTGTPGFNGDGPGTEVTLTRPHNGSVDARGRLIFGDSFNHRIRAWDPATDRVTTLAGNGEEGHPAEGADPLHAPLNYFGAVVVEPDGSILFSSITDHRVWRIRIGTNRLEVVAGTGERGYSGDGGPAPQATLANPYGMALGPDRQLYIADSRNRAIRVVDLGSGTIRTLVRGADPGP